MRVARPPRRAYPLSHDVLQSIQYSTMVNDGGRGDAGSRSAGPSRHRLRTAADEVAARSRSLCPRPAPARHGVARWLRDREKEEIVRSCLKFVQRGGRAPVHAVPVNG